GVHVAVPTVVRHERCTRSNGDRTPASPRRDEVRNEKGAPSGIRTRATALKGPRPGPLVDGGGRARIAPTPRARPSRRADLTRGRRPGQLAALAPSSTRAADADPRAPRGGGRERRPGGGAPPGRAPPVLRRTAPQRRATPRRLGPPARRDIASTLAAKGR